MSVSKAITTFIITALVGIFTIIFTVPKKAFTKKEDVKSKNEGEDKENLFI